MSTITDAQLAILTDVETLLRRGVYTRDEGVPPLGYRRTPLQALIDQGRLHHWDTHRPDDEGGRYRLRPTTRGLELLHQAVANRLIHLPGLTRLEAEGALF